MVERFRVVSEDSKYCLEDEYNKLVCDKLFDESDKDWLEDMVIFLNHQDKTLQNAVMKYGEILEDSINLKEKIARVLNEEINDCKTLYEVDEEDLYTQGRLVEIHNLIKVLL